MLSFLTAKAIRRKVRKLTLAAMPKPLAYQRIRNSLNLSIPLAHSKLRFEIASSTRDLKDALTLVQNNFQREGYAQKTTAGVRLTPYHLLPDTLVIVAKNGSEVVATNSLIVRTPFGVPLESSYGLESFLKNKGKVVEVSALAVSPNFQSNHGEVLFNLMKYLYHCNVELLGINTEVIGVNPKMVPLYEAILLFDRIPNTQTHTYDFANGAPVIPMHFSLDDAHKSFDVYYKNKAPHLNLMDFFLIPPPPQFILPSPQDLDRVLPQRNPEHLAEILSWDPNVLKKLSPQQRLTLESLYEPWPECRKQISMLEAERAAAQV